MAMVGFAALGATLRRLRTDWSVGDACDNPRMKTLRIATRKSPLALWQTEHVAALLRGLDPDLEITLVPLSTRGDQVLDRSLAAVGGKGLFLKELEEAMLRGEADCAVHSLKDVPMELEGPFVLPAILERADHADAFVSNNHDDIASLPYGARVGARRSCARCVPTCSWSTCAATSTRAWPSSMPASTTPSCSPARDCSAWASTAASAHASMRPHGCPHRHRARSRWNAARTTKRRARSSPR